MNRIGIFVCTTLLIAMLFSFCGFKQQNKTMLYYNTGDYDAAWKTIDSLDRQGLPKSALEKVNELYQRAKTDENPSQIIKTLVYKGKYTNQLEEDGLVKAIEQMRLEMEAETFPTKAILQSMLGELYARYLDNNHWKLKDRTTVTNYELTDIQTWSIEQLTEASNALYTASLADKQSQRVQIDNFAALLKSNDNVDPKYRPTLYDFLAHRAINHFKNERRYLTEPAYKFYINQAESLGSVSDFINYKFETKDSTSTKFQTLLLFQEVLDFHQKNENSPALVDVDLKRLAFVKQNAILSDKEGLYLAALKDLANDYSHDEVWAEIQYKIAEFHQQKGQNYQPNPDDTNKWELKTASDICSKAIAKYPESFGANQCRSLQENIKNKHLRLTIEEVNLRDKPFLALVQYRNVPKIYLKAVAITGKEKEKIQNIRHDKKLAYLNGLKPLKIWAENLPTDGDFQQHSVEIKLDKLPTGYYLIMASDNEKFSQDQHQVSYMFTHVSDLAFVQRNNQGTQEFVLLDRISGAPIEGAKAAFFKQHYNDLARKTEYKPAGTYTSDKDGFVYPNFKEREYYRVHISHGDDYLHLDNGFNSRYYKNDPQAFVTTHFFLDRAIYRPSQTVYFKGLVIEKDKERMPRILANRKVTVTLKDANYQEVTKLNLTTNEYGTINGSFTAPAGGLLGNMTISADVGGSKSFRVEEYKRPKFETTFKPLSGSYKLGDEVTLTGHAKAFAGNNIDGAKVQYRVLREVRYPYIPWWYRRWYQPSAPMEITNGTTTTKADGTFDIDFDLLPDPTIEKDKKPTFTYRIIADVTDITGETQTGESRVSASYIALDVNIKVPERIGSNDLKEFAITTQNWAGEFEAAKGKITIDLLQMPAKLYRQRLWQKPDQHILTKEQFETNFPYDVYKDEDEVQNWKTVKNVLAENFNTANKKELTLGKNTWRPGKYRLRLSTQDSSGSPIEIEKIFSVYDLNNKALAVQESDVFITNKTSYQPNETVVAHFGSTEHNIHLLLDIFKNKTNPKAVWHKIRNLKKFEIPVAESDRGNFEVAYSFVKNNRFYSKNQSVQVPWTNKELTIEYATFRDKLYPGQEEEWQIKLSGSKKDKVAAEMLAAMYDASLDQFAANNWFLNLFPSSRANRIYWQNLGFGTVGSSQYSRDWNTRSNYPQRSYRSLNWFGFQFHQARNYGMQHDMVVSASPRMKKSRGRVAAASGAPEMAMADQAFTPDDALEFEEDIELTPPRTAEPPAPPSDEAGGKTDFSEVKVRTNLNETVFFFPNLRTDAEGNIIIKFTMNEALTKWKFMGLAHTKDLQFATSTKEIVTQKDLMVVPNAPRFMREGDDIIFTAKVSNLTKEAMSGTAVLQLFDAISMEPIDALLGNTSAEINFNAAAGQSDKLAWKLNIPDGKVQAITHRVIAKSGNFSDGEESSLPVLTNRMLVTETMPLPVRGNTKKEFTFQRMLDTKSNTLQHHNYTLEFTSNPAWYAVQALPYMMEYPYDCTEQIFNQLYANGLATSVANQHPKIKRIFEQWKGTDALLSNLSKNQALKSALLEETPWVLDAQNEEEQKKRIGLLFDLNKMSRELEVAVQKITKRQLGNGGFSWFPGGRDSRYITQYLVEGMGHLDKLKVLDNIDPKLSRQLLSTSEKAVAYIDARMVEDYEELERRVKEGNAKFEDDHLSHLVIHYLYARSFFMSGQRNYAFNKKADTVWNYYLGQAEKYWLNKGIYQEGMLALALHRAGKTATPAKIIASLKERSLNHPEMGMYWKYNTGYNWYQLPIETHALMIEAFAEIGDNAQEVDDLKVWLLKNKQTNNWKTTKATSAAVYALLSNGDNWLLDDQPVQISLGVRGLDDQIARAQRNAEAGTGYFKVNFPAETINDNMATIEVNNPNNVVTWGGVYWQYFEDLDKITHFEDTPLKLDKKVFIERASDRGPQLQLVDDNTTVKVGDKLKIRIELLVDRTMEYVHMKDMRASGLEPINVLSHYKWQGGLGYYESTKDASTNFFFSYLPKGTYVFEYPLRVAHEGDFSNGITTIQSMYAPEFTSHSEGVRIEVK